MSPKHSNVSEHNELTVTVTMVFAANKSKYTFGALGNEALLALLKTLPHLAAEYRRTAERHPCSTPRTCEIRG